ncbi:hypothetical protein [Sulfurimonas paralvinellae]|uniref:Uncharacterized protein n=1 Tax=Sulfurimonas paralvinellae TaxID=317658 RepID=A0A7M1B6F1_9BACT|nr:hypothetical protein [Sulfurimonas paralvinellae]QOP45225.1 hypothetical protein FM071_02555 [Sulfurimonas paralvinellae]
MENPFENGHIKNYILLYVSVVVIMILFFIATSLFDEDEKKIEKRTFNTEVNASQKRVKAKEEKLLHADKPKFKLLKTGY